MSSDSPRDDQPIGMTVYSMPTLEQISNGEDGGRTRVGRWKMLAVFLVCAAPVIASYFTYYVVRPEGRRNFGELIDPQRPLPEIAGTTLDGQSVNLRALKGQWLLITVAGGACDPLCTNNLYLQRQLRESLGKEKDRLDRVWLINDAGVVPDALKPALKDATVLAVPSVSLGKWLEPQAGKALDAHMYLVDPLGNWMMRFPANLTAEIAPKVKADLERLMRASASWDTAGR
jgi:hypothetical protein